MKTFNCDFWVWDLFPFPYIPLTLSTLEPLLVPNIFPNIAILLKGIAGLREICREKLTETKIRKRE